MILLELSDLIDEFHSTTDMYSFTNVKGRIVVFTYLILYYSLHKILDIRFYVLTIVRPLLTRFVLVCMHALPVVLVRKKRENNDEVL